MPLEGPHTGIDASMSKSEEIQSKWFLVEYCGLWALPLASHAAESVVFVAETPPPSSSRSLGGEGTTVNRPTNVASHFVVSRLWAALFELEEDLSFCFSQGDFFFT